MRVQPYEKHHRDSARAGLWRCAKCLEWLMDSLDIAVHLGTMRRSLIYPKAQKCMKGATKDAILFVCREHKLEAA
jgi:hypothetical protein